jgi:hypothetical protein
MTLESNQLLDANSTSHPYPVLPKKPSIGADLSNEPMMLAAKERIATSLYWLRQMREYVISLGYMPPHTLTDSIESLESTLTALQHIVVDCLLPPDVQGD